MHISITWRNTTEIYK